MLAVALTLGACSRAPSPHTWEAPPGPPEQGVAIHFENGAQTYVDVYLVGETREWRLGRVAAGARTTFRVPEQELVAAPGFVRLAVIAASPVAAQAALDSRATFTMAQPASELLAQRWTFLPNISTSPAIIGTRVDVRDHRSDRP